MNGEDPLLERGGLINYAEINLTNLRNNNKIIRGLLSPEVKIISVVKADAYGHGAEQCSYALYEEGARMFAVASVHEAMQVRGCLPRGAEIIILGYTPPGCAEYLSIYGFIQTVYSSEYAEMLDKAAPSPVRVHIKVNTGMNRLGFKADENGITDVRSIIKLKKLRCEGIFTHFACADEPANPKNAAQFELFMSFVNCIESSDFKFALKHCANSGAVLNAPDTHLDAVRAGVIQYGLGLAAPNPDIFEMGMKPVMTLYSLISQIYYIKKGETVGYGASYKAEKDMRIIVMPIGYADGFIRAYKKCCVTVNGSLLPITGRICMDQCMADATDVGGELKIGGRVALFGGGALKTAEDYAEAAGTINYETVCLISKRVRRVTVT